MQYIFFGTPLFSEIILKKLIEAGYTPSIIVTNPDRPVGRKKIMTSPPVKKLIYDSRSEIRDKIKILQSGTAQDLKSKTLNLKSDLGVVASYSKIIPKEIINSFKLGVIGTHPSLLPKYRGASPIQSVLLNGETETGITLYLIDEKVDHGPILSQEKLAIAPEDNYETLLIKLANLSADLLIKTLPDFLAGKIKAREQDHSQATLTKKFTTDEAHVYLDEDSPELILRKIKALNPEPGVWTMKDDKRLKILDAEIKENKLVLRKIQWEGKRPQSI